MRLDALEKAKNYSIRNKAVSKYKYCIIDGNNSRIIRDCMALRDDRWEETSTFDKIFNFKWQPISRGINYDTVSTFGTRQLVNHIKGH